MKTIFGLFNNATDDNYQEFKRLFYSWKQAGENERKECCKEFISFANQCDRNSINKSVYKDSKKDGSLYSNDVFGYLTKNSSEDIYTDSLKKVSEDLNRIWNREKLLAEFDSMVNAIPNHTINIDKNSSIKRNKLEDMPEIKISPIGKSFNVIAKLPCFVCVDVETTGLSASSDRILEISAVKYEEFNPVEKFSTYIKFTGPIPEEAFAVNHITKEMVCNAPTISEISADLISFVGNLPIVGHNIAFDLKFIYTSGIDLISNRKIYDTYELAKKVDKDLSSYSLTNVCSTFQITYNPHDSLEDSCATGMLLKAMLDYYIEK
jgi:exonuclease, DNA polymerase III, epsilon subunit family